MRAVELEIPPVEADVAIPPRVTTRWRAFDICWKSKMTLGLMALGLMIQLLLLWG